MSAIWWTLCGSFLLTCDRAMKYHITILLIIREKLLDFWPWVADRCQNFLWGASACSWAPTIITNFTKKLELLLKSHYPTKEMVATLFLRQNCKQKICFSTRMGRILMWEAVWKHHLKARSFYDVQNQPLFLAISNPNSDEYNFLMLKER